MNLSAGLKEKLTLPLGLISNTQYHKEQSPKSVSPYIGTNSFACYRDPSTEPGSIKRKIALPTEESTNNLSAHRYSFFPLGDEPIDNLRYLGLTFSGSLSTKSKKKGCVRAQFNFKLGNFRKTHCDETKRGAALPHIDFQKRNHHSRNTNSPASHVVLPCLIERAPTVHRVAAPQTSARASSKPLQEYPAQSKNKITKNQESNRAHGINYEWGTYSRVELVCSGV